MVKEERRKVRRPGSELMWWDLSWGFLPETRRRQAIQKWEKSILGCKYRVRNQDQSHRAGSSEVGGSEWEQFGNKWRLMPEKHWRKFVKHGVWGGWFGLSPILQEDHIEETLCEQKVMSNFAGTGGCFICGMCAIFVCVSELDCLCYRLHDYCYLCME